MVRRVCIDPYVAWRAAPVQGLLCGASKWHVNAA
jgi:hypothetical protein